MYWLGCCVWCYDCCSCVGGVVGFVDYVGDLVDVGIMMECLCFIGV